MRIHLTAVLAIASVMWSQPTYSYNRASSITYTIGSQTLSGYSRTWKDPGDTDYYTCLQWSLDPPECTLVMAQINYVYVAGTLISPSGSTEGGSTTAYADASSTFSKLVPAVPPGVWTVNGDHKIFSDIYYYSCWFGFCSPPQYGGTYWFDIGTTSEQAVVCAYNQTVIDLAVIGVVQGTWPSAEPWERGVMARCGGNNVILFGYYNDSFGQFYSGTVTHDPCKSTVGVAVVDRAAGAHSHPYFQNETEFHRELGCLGNQEPISQQDLQQLNVANENFSEHDRVAMVATGERPFYLKTPTGSQVKRLDSSVGDAITVFP